ncbi:lysoplasmalogenase, partial [bacterium]
PMLPWVALTAIALIGLLAAEARGARPGIYVAKPLASAGFVGAAVAAGALGSGYGRAVLAALVLSWLGDVLLMSSRSAVFLAGLAAFLLAHVGYGAAFVLRGQDPMAAAGALAVLSAPALAVAWWLRPRLPAEMRLPVFLYIGVISVMVALAVGTVAAGAPWVLLAGAVAFYLSDLSVANDRFVREDFANRLWGLPLYYAAQLCFAWTVQG